MESAETHHRTQIASYLAAVQRRKEREYLLMRKYGTLFLRKVFPQATSWSASRRFELRLLREVFATLKRSWWKERVLWRLEIRARCHRRLQLARRAFHTWVHYVRARVADRHFCRKATGQLLHRLREICQTMRGVRQEARKLILVDVVLSQRVMALKLTCGLVETKIDVVVVSLWRRKLLARCLASWKAFAAKQVESRVRLRATSDVRAQRTVLHAWWSVVKLRRPARRRLIASMQRRQEAVAVECFRSWYKRWQEAISRQTLATHLQSQIAARWQRRWLQRWRSFVRTRHAERLADACAVRALVLRCLTVLRSHVNEMATRRTAIRMAFLRRSWDAWTNHVAAVWRERNAEKIRRADQRLRLSDFRKTFAGLQCHAALHRRKRALANVAERHFALHWFGVWHEQWKLRQCIARLSAQADAFREFSSLREALARWQQRFVARARRRDLLSRATRLVDSLVVVRCLQIWHRWAEQRVSERQRREQASGYRDRRLTLTSWSTWTNRVAERSRRNSLLAIAVERNIAGLTRKAWNAWAEARRCRQLTLFKLEQLTRAMDLRMAKQVLQTWTLTTRVRSQERQTMVDMAAWHVRHVKWRAFLQLKAYAAHRRQCHVSKKWLGDVGCLVQQALLRSCFRQWEQRYEKTARARTRYQRVLLGVMMSQWVANHKQRQELRNRKMKLKETGIRNTLSRWFAEWTSKLQQLSSHRILESQATERWRVSLLRDCLCIWLRNTTEQRRLREVERKRAWLRAELRRREERDQRALERMLINARYEFHLARKCVTRWTRRLARKRGLTVFLSLDIEYHEWQTRGTVEEIPQCVTLSRPISSPLLPLVACPQDVWTRRRRPQPRIPGFMQRTSVVGCRFGKATELTNQGLAESSQSLGMGAGDAGSDCRVESLPPSFFRS